MSHGLWSRPILVASLLTLQVVSTFDSAAAGEDRRLESIRTRHAELRRQYAETLGSLARELESQGAADGANEAWSLAVPPDPRRISLGRLPERVHPEPSLDLPQETRSLLTRLRQARQEQAVQLYLLSRQALNAGSVRYAYELLRETATQDPDNATARKVLGFVRVGDEWLTPFEARKRRTNEVWHDRFGWLPAKDVPRYEAGERHYNGRWITAEQESELRRDFENGWVVRTERYLVRTNHSLERGVEIAACLETFHDFFIETFAGFFTRPEDLQSLFRGGSSRMAERPPYEVHYYRTRDEYNRRLVPKIENISITHGLYYTSDRIAYFFHDDDRTNDDTLYHEATHQLMYECLTRNREVATQAHFWVIEGIACYMESFRPGEQGVSLGDPDHIRVRAARYRYLVDKHYVPLGRFSAMGLNEFQSVPEDELTRNYSQASGLAHFFMHYDGGRYRDALIEHLAQLYHGVGTGRRVTANLADLTGIAYAELDRQYGEYVKALGEPRAAAATP